MLWAFNPRPDLNYWGGLFTYHSQTYRGRLVTTLSTGAMKSVPVSSFSEKQAHGFGMATVWLVLFPLSVFWARYLRSTSRWIIAHIVVQTVGTLGVITFLTVILINSVHPDRPHAQLGVSIVSLMGVQVTMGLLNFCGLWVERFDRLRKWFQRVHYTIGASLLVLAVVQVGLGLDTLYPWVQPSWVAYFSIVLGWITAFAVAETWFRFRVYRKDPGFTNGNQVVQANINFTFDAKFKPDRDTVDDGVGMGMLGQSGSEGTGSDGTFVASTSHTRGLLPHDLRSFSWDSLNEAVLDGDDYFHEAGFDAEQFTFLPPAPPQRVDRRDASLLRQSSGTSLPVSPTQQRSSSFWEFSAETALPSLTEQDWKRILRARRTHVHTKLAIQKLAHLLVGELRPPALLTPTVTFDPTEFRRYAVTEKNLQTPLTTRTPVYSLRFCLLYPHATPGPFPAILPGQCVEIQARINGEWVSRYYTPVRGRDMGCFEVDVKAT
ncbi:S-methyl-5-thioribose-1-phosphate isomerase, partial [Borealophlyctis nickersoniae]